MNCSFRLEVSKRDDLVIVQIPWGTMVIIGAFKPKSNLKPQYLEKDCSALDMKSFCEMFCSYIMDRFQGKPNADAIHLHLQPFMALTWWNSVVQRGVKKKSLEEVTESEARHPLHQRRMELLRVKKTGSHSDHLFQL